MPSARLRTEDNVIDNYANYTASSAHHKNRPEAICLLKEAQENQFDAVIAEALAQLSRD